ncbi:hypothetical protein SuNHUV7_36540 (plasmid) [Pseudoseohaeicola sp. NH-UV-7]|uniref:MliC family protein n=1 Tax=Sulfitobacter sp. TBRI5 TaxID=2989732 RepID=UPI003A77897A
MATHHIRTSFWIALISFVAPGVALSATPAFDCAKADSSAEKAICASDMLAELDVELDRLYRLALNDSALGADRQAELKAMQRGWIKGRDACWTSDLPMETCVANAYAMRIHEIREGYAASRGADDHGVSLGPVAFDCPDLNAGLSAVFINAETPLVTLKWLENAIVLPAVPAASGARYESDIWVDGPAMLWTKGDEAMFTPPGGPEMICQLDDIG